MKLLSGSSKPLSQFSKGTAVTIGNFDGVHTGHQALLSHLRDKATALNCPMLVLLFEPQPAEYFYRQTAPARLSSLREKLDLLKQFKLDLAYRLRFNKELAMMPALQFAEHYFFNLLNAKYLLVGEDFHFGYERKGDVKLLKKLAEENNCQLEIFPEFIIENQRVSSTKIREALSKGSLEQAANLLGRTYNFCGRVIKGEGRGRQWGIPTANLHLNRLTLPLKGVFAVQVMREDKTLLNGVANLGLRPTLNGKKSSLEVHLFDFDGNLYGEMLKVFFIHKLRDEIRFSSIDNLIKQIHYDIAAAKQKLQTVCLQPKALTE